MRLATTLIVVVVVTGCSGRNAAPTAPSSTSLAAITPVVRAVTVDRTTVEAGAELGLTATVDDGISHGPLRFAWTVSPAGGTLTSDGSTARWRAPVSDPVPTDYVFSVAAIESGTTAAVTTTAASADRGVATSLPVTVNDARRETQAHATAFLTDLASPSATPAYCVRNFTDSCADGKRTAADAVTSLRSQYSSAATSYSLQLFLRSVEWANCTGPDGSATCALLVYTVDTVWTRRADGGQDHTHGYQYVRAVYERNRWWLCSSRFADNPDALR